MQSPRVSMPLNALRSFEAAARLGSFRAAAEELGVTPSAVSLQIRRLEQILGRPLFVRGHRSISLSETGEQLAPGLSELFSRLDQLLSLKIGPENRLLRVSAMPSFASQWLAPRLGDFSSRYGEFQVRVAGEDRLETFDRDEVDFGIRYGPGDYAHLRSEMIASAEATPVCSPEFAEKHASALTTPEGLLSLPLLEDEVARIAPGLPTWQSWFQAAGLRAAALHRGPRFESLHLALMAAICGQGVALGLTPLIDDDVVAGRLVRPFDVQVRSSFSFWLIYRPERARERKIASFRAWILEEMEDSRKRLLNTGPTPV